MSHSLIVVAGVMAAILFLINSAMFPRLLYIRQGKNRILKRNLALFLRKEMKWHAMLGWIGIAFVAIHIGLQWASFVYWDWGLKRSAGALSFLALAFVLWSGLLRSRKANGWRRQFHAWSSILFTFILLLHILW